MMLVLIILVTAGVAGVLLRGTRGHARERTILITRGVAAGDPLQALLVAPESASWRDYVRAWWALPPRARAKSAITFWWMLLGALIPG